MTDEERKARRREYKRAWRAANPEKIREYARARRAANPEKERERDRARYAANPEKERKQSRASVHKALYDLTLADKWEIFVWQGERCAICYGTDPKGKDWATEHSHATKKVRGVVCGDCNRGLGAFGDELIPFLCRTTRAIEYLKRAGGPGT